MKQLSVVLALLLTSAWLSVAHAESPVFSGPQIGEKLAPFSMKGVMGDTANQEVDLIGKAAGKPVVLVFVHQRTRPGLSLASLVSRYAATRVSDGLHAGVVYLTDDATATEKWFGVAKKNLAPGVIYGISKNGQEGPGTYGLNRNVELTILVGKEGKVTANFALVQPSAQVDGPKVIQAIVDVVGGTAPTIAELTKGRGAGMAMPRAGAAADADADDQQLRTLLRSVIAKDASEADVKAAVMKVEEYVESNPKAGQQLGKITKGIIDADKVSNYGTPPAQESIRTWAKKFGTAAAPKKD